MVRCTRPVAQKPTELAISDQCNIDPQADTFLNVPVSVTRDAM
jgi:hypothetical protein